MFTSNGEVYCKLYSSIPDSGIVELVGSCSGANRGYDELFLRRARAPSAHSAEPNYDDRFDRRLPPQSGGDVKLKEAEKDQDQDSRKVHFRNGARNMYGKDARDLNSGIKNGVAFDEDSSGSSDCGYVSPSRFTKMPQDYLRTQSDLKTPPGLKTPPDVKTPPPELKTLPQFLPPPGIAKRSPEFVKSHGERQSYGNQSHGNQSYGNQLLTLRAALSEKELQLVELREQHLNVLNRTAEARQNWEEALQAKDRVILHLHRKVQHQESQLDRQERENQENLYALRKRQEENAEVEKVELKVAFLETKNAQFAQELMEQQKLITRMKRHIDEQEKLCGHQCRKLERVNRKVQDLKAALQEKDEVADTQSKYVSEMKTLLWKRDSIIAQLQLTEQQLQSALAREKADREALSMSREKVQEEKDLVEKRLTEMQNQLKAVGNEASHNIHLEKGHQKSETRKLTELKDDFSNVQEGVLKDIDDKEGVMHRMQKRIRELQRSLKSKDIALSEKNNEYQNALQDIQRLAEDYEALKQEYEEVNKRNYELETTVSQFQEYSDGQMDASISEVWTPPVEVLPYDCSLGGSTGEDLGVDDTMLDSMEFESEQLSNASVYHANFEKIKCGTPSLYPGLMQIIEVEMPDIDQQQQKHGATPSQPLHSSFPPPPPPATPLPQSAATSPQRPPLGAPPRSSPPPSVGPSEKNCETRLSSEFEAKHSSIQDEIMKREQSWRKTEELMRAALTRRMKLLELARDVKTAKPDGTRSAMAESELHGQLRNQHHVQAESSVKGNADHKPRVKERHRINRCRKSTDLNDDHRVLNHHIPHRKVYGQKYHGPDCARRQRRQTHEQDIYQEDCRINHTVGQFKKGDVNNRRQHEPDQIMLPDRRKNTVRNNHLEDCTARSEHYGHYEPSGHHARTAYTRKGRSS